MKGSRMSWAIVDNKHKKEYDGNFISCEEQYERMYLKKVIKEEFPFLTNDIIDIAIAGCCAEIRAPRPRQVFWNCLKNKLGVG